MSGYIGKIAAIVTANTSDFTSKLAGTKKDVSGLGESIKSTIGAASSSATKSLNAIFTPLQKLQRALEASTQSPLNLRTEGQVRELQALVSLSEGLAKPLAGATRQFEQLSQQAQANFLPALIRSQTAVKALQTQFEATGQASGTGFEQARRQIEQTTQAVQRLTQAQQLASKTLTGNELQFRNPRLAQTLAAGAAASQQAAALPASALEDGSIARQTAALKIYQDAAVAAAARVESLRLTPNIDPSVIAAARSQLESLTESASRALAQVTNAIEISQNIGASTQLRSTTDPTGRTIQQRAADITAATDATRQRTAAEAALRSEQAARLAVANSLVVVDQRESDLRSLQGVASTTDPTGRSIQERAADITAAADATRQRTAAEAALRSEQAARLAVANSLLVVDQRESELSSRQGERSILGDSLAEQGRRRVQDRTGDINLDATPPPGGGFSGQAQRDIDALATRVGAVRQQLETLPNSVRTRFVPALLEARDTLVALQNAPGATVAQIQNAANAVERLEQNAQRARSALNFQVQFGGGGLEGLNRQFDERALQGYAAQLQVLQQTLGRVSAEARGPALQSFARLRDAIALAMDRGTLETAATREQIRGLIRDAVGATAAVAGIGQGGLLRQVQRTGDVATGRFSNVGFAVNQLAFAVDDFFSVTGSAEQRIRAIGNNITQFGLIAGGTAGLIVGLAAVLTAQGVVALIRFANGGTTAEDQTKALNAALQNQKSLVDELANSFRSLADSLGTGLFTKARQELEDFQKDVREIVEQRRAARDDRVVGTSPRVFAERAQQERVDRELAAEPNLARRQALARQREEAREVEQEIAERLRNTPAPNSFGLFAITRSRFQQLSNPRFGSGPSPTLNAFQQSLNRQRAAAQSTFDRLPPERRTTDNTFETRESRTAQIAELEELLGVLKPQAAQTLLGFRTLAARIVENTVNILEQNLALIERELLAAIDDDANRGLASVRAASLELAESVASLEESVAERIIGASAALAGVEDLGASLLSARDRLVKAREIENVPARGVAVAAATKEIAGIEAAIAARRGEVLAIERARQSVALFSDVLSRISTDLANTVAQEARGAADQARRDLNQQRGVLGAGLGGRQEDVEAAARRRNRLEQDAAGVGRRAVQVAAANDRAALQFQQQARAGNLGDRAQGLIRQRDQAQAVLDNERAPADAQINAQATLNIINEQLQAVFEGSNLGQAAARLADELDAAAAAAARQDELVQRGRELDLSPAEQAGRDLAEDIRAIQERFFEDAKGVGGVAERDALRADANADIDRVREEAFRREAPGIFALGDAVQNAVLQGPSRAALQATDVSTVEGASELNRLLRGDDAARDQDLAELQKQSAALEELVRIAREGGAVIAN